MKTRLTLAILCITAASFAQAQSSSAVGKDGTKPRPDPAPFYTPYTGPGFGNPDAKAREAEPVGTSKRKYHDASGTSAYSKSGTPDPTSLTPPPRKPKSPKKEEKAKSGSESPATTPASPPAAEKR